MTITDKRKKAMGFSDPYCEIRQAVVVSTNSDLKNLKELDGKKVGGQIGTTGLVETLPKAKSKAIVKTYDEVGPVSYTHLAYAGRRGTAHGRQCYRGCAESGVSTIAACQDTGFTW